MENCFAEQLFKLRKERNVSQRYIAKRCDVAPSTISAYEAGLKQPTIETAMKIADVLGVSLDELCRGGRGPSSSRNPYGDLIKVVNELVASPVMNGVEVAPDREDKLVHILLYVNECADKEKGKQFQDFSDVWDGLLQSICKDKTLLDKLKPWFDIQTKTFDSVEPASIREDESE